MTLQEIHAKIIKGEALTDEEKTFVGSFDLTKVTNDAASAARKKAELDAKNAQDALAKATADLAALQANADSGKTESQKQMEALTAKINALTEENNATKKRAAIVERAQTLRDIAKANGLELVKGTLSENNFFSILDKHVGELDLSNVEAVKASLATFKTENSGILCDPSSGSGSGVKGKEVTASGQPLNELTPEQMKTEFKGKLGI